MLHLCLTGLTQVSATPKGGTPMFQKMLSIWGLPALATAAVLWTAGPGYSQGYNYYDRYRHHWAGSHPNYGAFYKTYPPHSSYNSYYPSYASSPSYDSS